MTPHPTVPLELDSCVVVADLHLAGDPAGLARFVRLLELAPQWSPHLVILGDLFHYWFGRRHLRLPMFKAELDALTRAVAAGLHVRVVPGNRDFLLDRSFTDVTGVTVHPDEWVGRVGGELIHFSHGDLFGTADVRYQRMRSVLHSRMVRFLASHLPVLVLDRIASRLREHSRRVVPRKSESTLEPDRTEVSRLFRRGVQTVVCGHYHKLRDERFSEDAGGGRFMILEPFEDRGFVLLRTASGWESRYVGGGEGR
ncbi:MAG: UDP-2,3-diacylglucosamine diphosphatase [Planctomycetota bacterium]